MVGCRAWHCAQAGASSSWAAEVVSCSSCMGGTLRDERGGRVKEGVEGLCLGCSRLLHGGAGGNLRQVPCAPWEALVAFLHCAIAPSY